MSQQPSPARDAADESPVDPHALARRAAADIATAADGHSHDIAVILGSGWAAAADVLGEPAAELPVNRITGFAAPAVAGHGATVRSLLLAGRRVLLFLGRTHLYEGRGVAPVVHPVRTAAAAGCRQIILTNGCGSLRPEWAPGTAALISDHINLTGRTPLRGPTFVDMTEAYSARLRGVARGVDPELPEGVYIQMPGPQYETPAEIRMAGRLGADLVGMSTALETIAAREAGLEVLGISLVTNLAAGLSGQNLDHQEVLDVGGSAGPRVGRLLADVLESL